MIASSLRRPAALLALAFTLTAACHPRGKNPPVAESPHEEPVVHKPSPGHKEVPIWPGTPPDKQPVPGPETRGKVLVKNVSRPTMTVYPPKGKNTGAAVVVFPGGGFKALAIDFEGKDICGRLTSDGFTCVVLKYRVPNSGPYWNQRCKCHVKPKAPTALEDAQRTMGLVRLHAAQWHVDPHRVGVLGFSAGGFLVADISTHFAKRAYAPIDAADKQSCRPDFAVAIYPGHLCAYARHFCSFQSFDLNPDIQVTDQTPPTFLLQAEDDPVDSVQNSLVYFAALKKAGVPTELHVYAHGGHAFGLGKKGSPIAQWPRLVETWLRNMGTNPKRQVP